MSTPTGCPRCNSPRIWMESPIAAPGAGRRPVRCTVCRRDAWACAHCGWEFVAAGPHAGECACVEIDLVGRCASLRPPRRRSAAAAGGDADEDLAVLSYRARRALAPVIAEAAGRAAASARLEAALRRSAGS